MYIYIYIHTHSTIEYAYMNNMYTCMFTCKLDTLKLRLAVKKGLREYLQDACAALTEISESLRKPPGVYGIIIYIYIYIYIHI